MQHQVWIDAPIEKVYEMITSAENIGKWWDKQTAKDTDSGLIFEHTQGQTNETVQMKVLEMITNRRMEWECISSHSEITPASAWTNTHVSFDLVKREDHPPANTKWGKNIPAQTVLDFRHSDWDENSDFYGFCNFAWGHVMMQLKEACES